MLNTGFSLTDGARVSISNGKNFDVAPINLLEILLLKFLPKPTT